MPRNFAAHELSYYSWDGPYSYQIAQHRTPGILWVSGVGERCWGAVLPCLCADSYTWLSTVGLKTTGFIYSLWDAKMTESLCLNVFHGT